ncbi:MAG: radical SAM protein [Spirochaetales bacterium]|nr:radical SAM protein [Spirochaetales bacterium]
MSSEINITEVNIKSLITASNLPDADYVINPYSGCLHSCIYCYARFIKRFTGHDEPWGSFVDVKINCAQVIPHNGNKFKGKALFMSSVTDPYLELEKKYKLTRSILEKLAEFEPDLSIQTKSDLVVRDCDVLKRFNKCRVGLTITTLDDAVRAQIEPRAVSVERRIAALKRLKRQGLTTYVFIGPLLPFITDWKEIIKRTKDFTDCYYFENLNIYGTIKKNIYAWLGKHDKDCLAKYMSIQSKRTVFWETVGQEIQEYCAAHNINHKLYFDHKAQRK